MEAEKKEYTIELTEDEYNVLGGFNPITILHQSLSPADEPGVYKLTQEDMKKVQAALDKTAGWVPGFDSPLNAKLQTVLQEGLRLKYLDNPPTS